MSSQLTPGQCIKPAIDSKTAVTLVEKLYRLKVDSIVELDAYDDRNYRVKCSNLNEDDDIAVAEHGYVLKIVNALDSRNTDYIDAQTKIMLFLNDRGIVCPVPVKNSHGSYFSSEDIKQGNNTTTHIVRLLVYRPGVLMRESFPLSRDVAFRVGELAARLDLELQSFDHPAMRTHRSTWNLVSVPRLREFIFAVKNPEHKNLCHSVIDAFERKVLTHIDELEWGIIHQDINEQNLIVDEEATKVVAVLDFGDMQRSPLVFELAIALCYMILYSRDLEVGKHVIMGYETARKLNELEMGLLHVAVCSRLCQSLVMSSYSYANDPTNDYLLKTQKHGWKVLGELFPMSPLDINRLWEINNTT